ncbi:hypothetical protein [Methylobacterium sp. NFXW15]|uniref:hypothetical protein n=1 Tax=Methylobacterium sp. NFXW15 TaxID=2819512 RepID=UPI003CF79E4F
MKPHDPLVTTTGAPLTTGFQLQLGPDGRCRIVLLGRDDAPLATLDLDAAQADRLAQELGDRRKTYAQSRAGGTPH